MFFFIEQSGSELGMSVIVDEIRRMPTIIEKNFKKYLPASKLPY